MSKYGFLLLILFCACSVGKRPEPQPPAPAPPTPYKVKVTDVTLYSYECKRGEDWKAETYSNWIRYPGTDTGLFNYYSFFRCRYCRYTYTFREGPDSVEVGPLRFAAEDGYIKSPIIKGPNSSITFDTSFRIRPSEAIQWHDFYFGDFLGKAVKEEFYRPDGSLSQRILKDTKGEDSLYYAWYPDGSLLAMCGVLGNEYHYPDGSWFRISDTVLKGFRLSVVKVYYAGGRIQRQEYYYNDNPVHTWTYYNKAGKVTRQVRKKDLTTLEPVVEDGFLESPTYMEQVTLSGVKEWESFLRDSLTAVLLHTLKNTRVPIPRNEYVFLVEVSPYGDYRRLRADHISTSSGDYFPKEVSYEIYDAIRTMDQLIPYSTPTGVSRDRPMRMYGTPVYVTFKVKVLISQ